MRMSRRPGIAAVVLAVLVTGAACSTSGDDDSADTTTTAAQESTTTQAEETTTTVAETTTTTEADPGDITCPAEAPAGDDAAPKTETVFTEGWATVSYTGPDGEVCEVFAIDPTDQSLVKDGGRDLDVYFIDDMDTQGVQISITSEPLATGEIDAFVRIEADMAAWVDSLHSLCTVELTGVDAESVSGSATCDELEPWSGTETPITDVKVAFSAKV